MDVARIREDFPILRRTMHGKPLVYLDNAATSQKPTAVMDAERWFYETVNANPHRGVYALSEEATDAVEGARAKIAHFLHAPAADEVVFVRGATEGLNLVAAGLGRSRLKRDDRVVSTVMEHHANIVPWQFLRSAIGIRLDFLDIDDHGQLRLEELDRALDAQTKVVTLTHVSNVLGTVNPVREVAERAHAAGAVVVLDAAQSAPHLPIDVQALGVDFLAFSGHKTLGPTGIGALWGRMDLLKELPPYMGGGHMISTVDLESSTFQDPPARFEAGTAHAAGAYGLGVALDYLERIGWDEIKSHDRALQTRLFQRGRERFGDRLRVVGPPDPKDRESVFSFAVQGVHPHDIASLLDSEGVAVRSGMHCAQPLMKRLNVPALTRASPYLYNTVAEIDRLYDALEKIDALFSGTPPDPPVC